MEHKINEILSELIYLNKKVDTLQKIVFATTGGIKKQIDGYLKPKPKPKYSQLHLKI